MTDIGPTLYIESDCTRVVICRLACPRIVLTLDEWEAVKAAVEKERACEDEMQEAYRNGEIG